MPLFKKNKLGSMEPSPANSLSRAINQSLHQLADKISVQEKRMSICKKKIAVTLFCLPMIAVSMSTLYWALFVPAPKPVTFLKIHSITKPISVPTPDSILQYKRPHIAMPSDSLLLDSLTK